MLSFYIDQDRAQHISKDLDVIDLSVFSAMRFLIQDYSSNQFMVQDGRTYTKIKLNHIIKLLPIIQIGTKRGILNRVMRLCDTGMIDRIAVDESLQEIWYAIGDNGRYYLNDEAESYLDDSDDDDLPEGDELTDEEVCNFVRGCERTFTVQNSPILNNNRFNYIYNTRRVRYNLEQVVTNSPSYSSISTDNTGLLDSSNKLEYQVNNREEVKEEGKKKDSKKNVANTSVLYWNYLLRKYRNGTDVRHDEEPDMPESWSKEVVLMVREFMRWVPDKFLKHLTATELDEWADTFDKLVRIDRYDLRKVWYVCKWARENEFWKNNFFSPVKLRRKSKSGVRFIELMTHQKEQDETSSKGRMIEVL